MNAFDDVNFISYPCIALQMIRIYIQIINKGTNLRGPPLWFRPHYQLCRYGIETFQQLSYWSCSSRELYAHHLLDTFQWCPRSLSWCFCLMKHSYRCRHPFVSATISYFSLKMISHPSISLKWIELIIIKKGILNFVRC